MNRPTKIAIIGGGGIACAAAGGGTICTVSVQWTDSRSGTASETPLIVTEVRL